MWEKNPRCFWCGRPTVFEKPKGKEVPKNFATLDHLRPRHDPTRHEPCKAGEIRIVLACWECNNVRDVAEREQRGAHYTTKRLVDYSDSEVIVAYRHAAMRLAQGGPPKRTRPLTESLVAHIIPEMKRRGLWIGEVLLQA